MYLGAKHMVTGYDHLLFLFGVIFFLYRLKDVVQYVSLFTIGHSATLLLGVLGGIRANPYLVDAIIGLSVVYKAFDNMDGFRRFFGWEPNPRVAVLLFGLFHGFGLATMKRRADEIGATLTIDSVPDAGTTVRLLFDARADDSRFQSRMNIRDLWTRIRGIK